MLAPLLAEVDFDKVVSYVVAALSSGGAVAVVMGAYYSFRDRRRKAKVDDAEAARKLKTDDANAERDQTKLDNDLVTQQFRSLIDELRASYKKDLADLREAAAAAHRELSEVQEKTTAKILLSHQAHQECERRYVILEERIKYLEGRK